MIYIYKGWVRVLYEDQGPAFVMQAGDCVLQPPFIRHRVLETSGGFEVIEIGHPAEHETFADHQMELPKPTEDPTRDFSGQQWVCHYAANATWAPFRIDGFECRDIGIGAATKGLASVRVARLSASPRRARPPRRGVLFTFVLEGGMTLRRSEGDDDRLGAGDAFVVPASMSTAFADCTEDLELLEVALPAGFATSASWSADATCGYPLIPIPGKDPTSMRPCCYRATSASLDSSSSMVRPDTLAYNTTGSRSAPLGQATVPVSRST